MAASSRTIRAGSILPPSAARALVAVCCGTVIYGTAVAAQPLTNPRGFAAWGGVAVFLVTLTLATERAATSALILAAGLAGVEMQLAAPGNGAFVAVIAAIAMAGLRLDDRPGRRIAAVCGVGFLAASAISMHASSASPAISVIPALVFTYLGSTAVRRLRVEQQRTRELLEEVIAGRDARIHAAALDERARLAREMHDVLAHTLSALSIQLEGTRMLSEQRASDPAVVTAVERAGKLAREGLSEARQAVHSLRGEDLPGPDLLPHLAQSFEDDTGAPCSFRLEGEPIVLSADARLALYRIAQEALTNVRKHADAVSVEIVLTYTLDGIELIVENEGVPRASPLPSGGYGISGMRERAALLGGTLEAGPNDTGFEVRLWIPTRANVPSAS